MWRASARLVHLALTPVLALTPLTACWTGSEPVAAPIANAPKRSRPPVPLIDVAMERTGCMGPCPSYTVAIYKTGNVEWVGEANVAAIGARSATVERIELERLARAVDKAHFFDLDDSGHVPTTPSCTRTGNIVSCSLGSFSMCTDTSHAVITVTRGTRTHQVDDAHCSDEDNALVGLETLIDEVANTQAWVGR